MKYFASKKQQNCITRWIILFGVLAGLFFSGGEGIQLLPFSVTEDKTAENTSVLSEKLFKTYSYSVNNSGSHQFGTASKLQKNDKRSQLDKAILTATRFDWIQNPVSPQEQNFHEIKLFSTFPFLSPPSDRAPPSA